MKFEAGCWMKRQALGVDVCVCGGVGDGGGSIAPRGQQPLFSPLLSRLCDICLCLASPSLQIRAAVAGCEVPVRRSRQWAFSAALEHSTEGVCVCACVGGRGKWRVDSHCQGTSTALGGLLES